MAEQFSFFDPIETTPGVFDREYNAQEFTDYFRTLINTGIIKQAKGNPLKVGISGGGTMNVTIESGVAFLEGRYYKNTEDFNMTLDTETLGQERIDRIVVRLDLNTEARYVRLFVKKGGSSTSPQPPELTRTEMVYEISLAQVKIKGGQTFIEGSDIIDERGIEDICPWADSAILPNFNDQSLENLVNTVYGHVGNINNPHQTSSQQINYIEPKHYNDKPETYPIGISIMQVRDYVKDSTDPAETWYEGKGTIVTFRSPSITGSFQLHSHTNTISDNFWGITGDVFFRPIDTTNNWRFFYWAFGFNSPFIDRDLYHRNLLIDPINGDDNNNGWDKPIKTVYRAGEVIKPLMLAGSLEITITSKLDDGDASYLLDVITRMKTGPQVYIDFKGSRMSTGGRYKGLTVPLYIRDLVVSGDFSFSSCAPIELSHITFELGEYEWSNFPPIHCENGHLHVWFCEFKNVKPNIRIIDANSAAHIAAIGNKFTNCSSQSYAYTCSNSIIQHTQNTITGSSPVMNTEYSAGKIFFG